VGKVIHAIIDNYATHKHPKVFRCARSVRRGFLSGICNQAGRPSKSPTVGVFFFLLRGHLRRTVLASNATRPELLTLKTVSESGGSTPFGCLWLSLFSTMHMLLVSSR